MTFSEFLCAFDGLFGPLTASVGLCKPLRTHAGFWEILRAYENFWGGPRASASSCESLLAPASFRELSTPSRGFPERL